MLEKALERKACLIIKDLGGLAIKFSPVASRGWPDRVMLLKGGQLFFVEFKRKGLKPTKLQNIRALSLIDRGYRVYSCDSITQFHHILDREGLE